MGGSESKEFSQIAGFRVVNLYNKSPAHLAGLELFFDCILEIDGLSFVSPSRVNPTEFSKRIAVAENKTIKLVVFNSRTRAFRDIWITPRKWSDEPLGLLGASVRFIENVTECPNGLRVLSVFPNSPASLAGLLPGDDYLMGSISTDFDTLDDLLDVVSQARSEPEASLQLSTYNSKQENVRRVLLQLNENWGGKGSLGCDVGQGLLHRFPYPRTIHTNSYVRYVYGGHNAEFEDEDSLTGESCSSSRMTGISPTYEKYDEYQPNGQQADGTMNGNEKQQFLSDYRDSVFPIQELNVSSSFDDIPSRYNQHKNIEMLTNSSSGIDTISSEKSPIEYISNRHLIESPEYISTVPIIPQSLTDSLAQTHPISAIDNQLPPNLCHTQPSFVYDESLLAFKRDSPPRPGILYQSK